MKKILITGGAGFIGSNLINHFVINYPEYSIFNLDKLTYASNIENLSEINSKPNYKFIQGDIVNQLFINDLFKKHQFDSVIHLAAESHVDRSIQDPSLFAKTNVIGTINLIDAFLNFSKKRNVFYHVSTDEVYGSLGDHGQFSEKSPYSPNSPYSASKASSDHFVRAYGETYALPYLISNCSNNYGKFQHFEKLIPMTIKNIFNKIRIPVYGDGNQVRDWINVQDHIEAIDLIFHKGQLMETYCIGGDNERKNIHIVNLICELIDKKLKRNKGESLKLIDFVTDRPGHDYRYSIETRKIKSQLGWSPRIKFQDGINDTIDWYISKLR